MKSFLLLILPALFGHDNHEHLSHGVSISNGNLALAHANGRPTQQWQHQHSFALENSGGEKLCMLHSRICILLSARFVGLQHEAWGMRQTPCNGFLINFCQSPVRANQASCLGQIMRIDLQQISKVHKADREGSKPGRKGGTEGCWAWFPVRDTVLRLFRVYTA